LLKKQVLVIDESAFIRQFLKESLNNCAELNVAAAVSSPVKALELLKIHHFDVVTMDIEMTEMDGLGFLQYLMRCQPIPVVVISTATQANSNASLLALSLGVTAVIAKPTVGYKEGLELLRDEIAAKVIAAANNREIQLGLGYAHKRPLGAIKPKRTETTAKVIAIGASTGGTSALVEIFKNLHPELPGIIVVQHMPGLFTDAFAETLNQTGFLQVKEAKDGQYLVKGTAIVVPGGKNVSLHKVGPKYWVKISPRLRSSVYNPSIDYTLTSVAEQVGENAMGVILTGMGDDGAKGLKAMYDQGAYTVAQDEKTSVIFGMPHKAIVNGGVSKVVALGEIAREINKWGLRINVPNRG
jgi:two-component system, chemotaxis family, protein-glutamate methylesterase/glutaminase